MEITPFNPISIASLGTPAKPGNVQNAVNNTANSFSQVLNSLNESQQNADSLVSQLAAGGNVDISQVMLANEENDVNFRVTMAIRDQLVNAYREVMRMAV